MKNKAAVGAGVKDKALPYSRILTNVGGIMKLENYSLIAITVIIHLRNINRDVKTNGGKA